MYILFINSGGKCDLPPKKKKSSKCDIFFSAQFNNNNNNKKFIQTMGSTQPNLMHVGCVGLGWTYVMG